MDVVFIQCAFGLSYFLKKQAWWEQNHKPSSWCLHTDNGNSAGHENTTRSSKLDHCGSKHLRLHLQS